MNTKVKKIGNSLFMLLRSNEAKILGISERDDVHVIVTKLPKNEFINETE